MNISFLLSIYKLVRYQWNEHGNEHSREYLNPLAALRGKARGGCKPRHHTLNPEKSQRYPNCHSLLPTLRKKAGEKHSSR